MKALDLFSGIGGFSLGLERTGGFETVCFSEIDPFCQRVLKKHWPDIPVVRDIHHLHYENGQLYDTDRPIYTGQIDLVCGGFPCQPFSIAGRKTGTQDNRDLWPEMFRIIQQIQPSWVIGENVANFINMAFTRTKVDLESEGYSVQPLIIPACAIGAPHRRDRVWIVAHAQSQRHDRRGKISDCDLREQSLCEGKQENRHEVRSETATSNELCSTPANNSCKRTQGVGAKSLHREQAFSWCKDVRRIEDYFNRPDLPQPLICRKDHGFSGKLDRLKALGNAVVPQIPEIIGQAIVAALSESR